MHPAFQKKSLDELRGPVWRLDSLALESAFGGRGPLSSLLKLVTGDFHNVATVYTAYTLMTLFTVFLQ